MEKPETKPAACETGQGALPACAPLAFPYIPMQGSNPTRFSRAEALKTGTLFPGLELPFKAAIQARTQLPNTALAELMALELYASYVKLAREGRAKYISQYGPLSSDDLTPEGGYDWLKDPWPWEAGGNG